MIDACIVALALGLDFVLGDPRNRYHPTAWMGNMLARMAPLARNTDARRERIGGVAILVVSVCAASIPAYAIHVGLDMLGDGWPAILLGIITSAILFKCTIAIRGMSTHALAVADSLDTGKVEDARTGLAMIVKRSTARLDERHIISGVLESVSENTVDGTAGPLFYYALLGLPGAFAYRMVNTADSMIGYKTEIFCNIGWFAAISDTVLNYIPARLCALVMIVSAAILGYDWRSSYRIMTSHGSRTQSRNAGYPMAALAGALGVRLEKMRHYSLGDGTIELGTQHIRSAVSIMRLTTILFAGMITVPLAVAVSEIGRWVHA